MESGENRGPTEPQQNAGRTDFDVTDRLAILNLVHAYCVELDRFNLDAWFDLFSDDAIFTGHLPNVPPVELSDGEFRSFFRQRFGGFERRGNQRRHLISNVVFVAQEADSAHTLMSGILTDVKDKKIFTALTSLNYEGWYVKNDGVWKIHRWTDAPDTDPDASASTAPPPC